MFDISSLILICSGGATAPRSLIEAVVAKLASVRAHVDIIQGTPCLSPTPAAQRG